MKKFIIEVDAKELAEWHKHMVEEGYSDPDTDVAYLLNMSLQFHELNVAKLEEVINESPGMVVAPGRDSMAVL